MRAVKYKAPEITIPDNKNFCNIAAEVQDGKLIIHILAIDRYIYQIELGEKLIHRIFPGHYLYSNQVNEYYGEISITSFSWATDCLPIRFLGDSEKTIAEFTGITLQRGFETFLDLLSRKYIRGEKSYQKSLRSYEEKERLFELIPEEPDDILDYANNYPLCFSSYLISSPNRLKKSKRDFYCTSCYYQYTDKPMARGKEVKCPNCGRTVEVKYKRYFHPYDRSNFVIFQLAKDGSGIFARYYLCQRVYTGTYQNVQTDVCELGRYYFAPGISRLWTRSRSCQSTQNQCFTDSKVWYNRGMFFFYCENIYGGYAHARDIILKVFPHCQLDAYRQRFLPYRVSFGNISSYIEKYTRAPQLEYFIKSKLDQFVKEYMGMDSINSCINWRGRKLESIFGLSREIIKAYIFTRKIKDSAALEYAKAIFKVGKFSEENLNLMWKVRKDISEYAWVQFLDKFRKCDIIGVLKYLLAQQMKEERYTGKKPSFDYLIGHYKDYLNMAEKVQYNLESDYFRYPKYLKKAHDDVQKLIKVRADKELEDRIRKQARKLNKYCFEFNGLILRPFQSAKEITKEAKTQNICIAVYIDRYSNGETGLFCIRKKESLQTPFYAMELNKGQIIQVRGKNNIGATPEVNEFVEEFKAECLEKAKKPQECLIKNRIPVAI